MKCNCGSHAINHNRHGRDGSRPDLCDVCFWRYRDVPEIVVSAGCKNCKFATFQRTETGRIKKLLSGTCSAPVPEFKYPECVRGQLTRYAIWPDNGKDCPTFQPIEKTTRIKP